MTEQITNDSEEEVILEGEYQQPTHSHKICKTIKEVGRLLQWITTEEIKVQTGKDGNGNRVFLVEWAK